MDKPLLKSTVFNKENDLVWKQSYFLWNYRFFIFRTRYIDWRVSTHINYYKFEIWNTDQLVGLDGSLNDRSWLEWSVRMKHWRDTFVYLFNHWSTHSPEREREISGESQSAELPYKFIENLPFQENVHFGIMELSKSSFYKKTNIRWCIF